MIKQAAFEMSAVGHLNRIAALRRITGRNIILVANCSICVGTPIYCCRGRILLEGICVVRPISSTIKGASGNGGIAAFFMSHATVLPCGAAKHVILSM